MLATEYDVEKYTDKIGRKRKMPLTEQSGVMVFVNFLETRGKFGDLS